MRDLYTFLSYQIGKSPEGASTYWKDYINEFSNYIYASALVTADFTATGEDPGGTAASYGATAAAPEVLATLHPSRSMGLSNGADAYAYSAGVNFRSIRIIPRYREQI